MSKWIIDEGQNQIFAVINGKRVPLRRTVYQNDCYLALIEKSKAEAKESENALKGHIEQTALNSLDVAFIALNPLPDGPEFSRQDIQNALDLDQIFLLAQTWLEKKVFNPSLETSPFLAPAPEKAGK